MKKMERLIGIIYALKENKKLTATEIANIFEVSERTIYRDIDALSQLRVPIKAFEGSGGGYEIDEGYFLPSIGLNQNEILYLLISLKVGEIVKVPNMKRDYETLKYKLLNILDINTKEKYLKVLKRINFEISNILIKDYRADLMEKIISSFLENKNLLLNYYTPKKDEYLEREVTPYELFYYDGSWYIKGYCHLRKAERVFRIDRIKDIIVSDHTYDLATIESNSMQTNGQDTKKVILEMSRGLFETVENDRIFRYASNEFAGNTVKMEFETDQIDSIMKLAFQNYKEVKLIEPIEMIDKLKEMCTKIIEKY